MKQLIMLIFALTGILLLNAELRAQPSVTWERVLTFTNNCQLNKTQQTSDGGYVAIGESRIGIRQKMFLVKYNRYGDILWTKHFDQSVDAGYGGYWVEETSDKGYIVAGRGEGINTDAYLVKTDSLGNIQWYKTFGGADLDQARCVKQLDDKGYILLTNTNSYGPTVDILVIRTDSLGNEIWSKIYGGNNFAEYAMEVEIVNNAGFVLVGTVRPGHENLYLLRLDNNGDTLWSKSFTEYLSSEGYSIDIANDGGFIVGGTCDSLDDNNKKSYVIKTDSLGNLQRSKRYTTNFNEACFSVRKLRKSGYVLCGMSDSLLQNFERAIIRIIDDNGNLLKEKYFRPSPDQNSFYSVEETNDNGFILCGYADIGSGRGYIVRTDSLLNLKPVGIWENAESLEDYQLFQNYPNPFNSQTKIRYSIPSSTFVTLKVFDITGREIKTLVNDYKQAGNHKVTFNSGNLPSGVYYYELTAGSPREAGENTSVKRMVLIK